MPPSDDGPSEFSSTDLGHRGGSDDPRRILISGNRIQAALRSRFFLGGEGRAEVNVGIIRDLKIYEVVRKLRDA